MGASRVMLVCERLCLYVFAGTSGMVTDIDNIVAIGLDTFGYMVGCERVKPWQLCDLVGAHVRHGQSSRGQY